MNTKTSAFKQLFKGLLVDMTVVMSDIENTFPTENKELSEAVRTAFLILDEYSELAFDQDANQIMNAEMPIVEG